MKSLEEWKWPSDMSKKIFFEFLAAIIISMVLTRIIVYLFPNIAEWLRITIVLIVGFPFYWKATDTIDKKLNKSA